MSKLRQIPTIACSYNDTIMFCSSCHNRIIFFGGYNKYIVCRKCGRKIKDRIYKESCTAYKIKKKIGDSNYEL